jgi:glycosyltransferase involved in cell wall biosynthesis
LLASILRRWRQWDFVAAQRLDSYVANSEITRLRIHRYFAREATVLHPPVMTSRFSPAPEAGLGEHFLVLSEVMAHKRIEVAVRACSELALPLVVAGDGPDSNRLRRIAGPSVRFAGRVSDAEAERLLRTARAVIVTATEEFGIVAVEAQASGRPVIALRDGGVLETVLEGKTGVFFDRPEPDCLAEVLRTFDPGKFSPEDCVRQASHFAAGRFRERFAAIVAEALEHDGRRSEERRVARRRYSAGRGPRGLARASR